MIQEVKTAVVALMIGDSVIKSTLAANPDDGTKPAVFAGTRNTSADVYPSLTYRVETASPDKRFKEPFPLAPGASRTQTVMSNVFLEVEVWDNSATSANLAAVGSRLMALFNDTRFPVTGGCVFRCECVTDSPDHYDKNDNVWFSLHRFAMKVATTP